MRHRACLCAAIVILLISATHLYIRPQATPPSKRIQTSIRATPSSLGVHKPTYTTPDTFYQTIIDNNIFRPLGWTKPVSRPQFKLIATITGIKNAPPNALILHKNTLHTLTIGETIGKETTLTDVQPKHVILRQNDKQTTLRLTNPFLR